MASSESNGDWSPANWARKMAGPLMVFMRVSSMAGRAVDRPRGGMMAPPQVTVNLVRPECGRVVHERIRQRGTVGFQGGARRMPGPAQGRRTDARGRPQLDACRTTSTDVGAH